MARAHRTKDDRDLGGLDDIRPAEPYWSNPFSSFHPAVAFCYLACALGFAMAAMQPAYVALSLAGALACAAAVRGPRHALRSLAWAAPLWAGMAVLNALLSTEGTTPLLEIFGRTLHLEALAYGACSGGMLVAVLLWFSSYAATMTSDASLALFGNVAPTVSLMVTQVLRLIPQFVARGRSVMDVQRATSAAAPATRRAAAADRLRVVSVLMGWGMEDGLVRGDAMRARGYESGMRRTTYRRYRLGRRDAVALAVVAALAAANVPLAAAACAQFSFYPALSALVAWWGYLPYALLMALPPACAAKEWLRWRS